MQRAFASLGRTLALASRAACVGLLGAFSATVICAGPVLAQTATPPAVDAPRGPDALGGRRDVMYMVSRWHVPNVSARVTPALDRAHKDHIKAFSVSVTSANMLDPQGKVIGVISIKGFPSYEQARKYVYDDPYTKAGLYSKIELQPIDLYVLNGEFARAPEWVMAERPEERYKYVPATPQAKDCPK